MTVSLDDYRASLLLFSDRAPELLQRHGATSDHAAMVRSFDLKASLEAGHFTVALIGRMKAGKSTLLNALLDGRRLAPVAVNEMTATVNWFDSGDNDRIGQIEIHWRDKSRLPELRPIEAISAISGNSDEAKMIEYVRFWSDSPFLEGVRLVDAPGLMSNNDSHQAATMDMLTRQYGAKADATILVLPHVVYQSDRTVLDDFSGNTRLPGQDPYNTLAVFQRWESLNDPEPEKAAWDLARNFKDRLRKDVSDVIPVSGLMSIFARTTSEDVMDRIASLATRSEWDELKAVLKIETRFEQDRDGLFLNGAKRAALFAEVRQTLLGDEASRAAGTFEMIRFAISLAHRRGISSGEKLRVALNDLSNIDRLKETIERRFCAISGLIQAGAVLKKALDPCRSAQQVLRQDLEQRRQLVRTGERLLATAGMNGGDYIEKSLPIIRGEMAPIEATMRELDKLVASADQSFNLLMDDIKCLNDLGGRADALPTWLEGEARQVFGQHGFDRAARLGVSANAGLRDQHARAEELHQRFFVLSHTNKIARHAEARLSLLLGELELLLAA